MRWRMYFFLVMSWNLFFTTSAFAVSLVDPTRPLHYQGDALMSNTNHVWHLQMIHYSEYQRFALLNEQFVSEGSQLGSFHVLQIGRESVWLSDGKKDLEVPLVNEIKA